MRRSSQVAAPLLAAAALALSTGCRRPDMQRCVDENNHVVADSFCQNQPNQQQQRRPDGHGGFIPFLYPYRYYYGGVGGYAAGTTATGGSFTPTPGRSYSTSRGGFGRSFSSGGEHGASGEGSGHGGEGGGHGGGAGE